MDLQIQTVIKVILTLCSNKKLATLLDLLSVGIEAINKVAKTEPGGRKLKILKAAMIEVAKGKDGILGTEDDLIPKDLLDLLSVVLDTAGLFENLIDYLVRTAKENPGWWSWLACKCCCKPKK